MDAAFWVRRVVKPLLFLLCLAPAGWLVAGLAGVEAASLGANPAEKIQDTLGIWGLRLLIVTLAVTPLREILRWPQLARLRRMLGLFAFAYVLAHFLFYVVVDQGLAWQFLLEDVAERPFITAGFAALLLLLPLAATSTQAAMRRLGRRWQRLHRLVYPAAILGCVHYYWQVKADLGDPMLYFLVLATLLLWRLERWGRRRVARQAASEAGAGRGAAGRDGGQDQQPARGSAPAEALPQQ